MRLLNTENVVLRTTFCLSSCCVPASLPTIASPDSKVLMSIRFCIVSCNTLCTLESELRTVRVRLRIWRTYSLLSNMKRGIIAIVTIANMASIEKRYQKAPINSANTDKVLGMVSARKSTTTLTSVSSLLSTSPECRDSFPCHSALSMRSRSWRCIWF